MAEAASEPLAIAVNLMTAVGKGVGGIAARFGVAGRGRWRRKLESCQSGLFDHKLHTEHILYSYISKKTSGPAAYFF